MKKLRELVKDYNNGDKNTLVEIINEFKPAINKYKKESYYEDLDSELTLFMMNILDKISKREDILKDDDYLRFYILKSLKNKYIEINKKSYNIYSSEIPSDNFLDYSGYELLESDIVFYDMIKKLNIYEKDIIIKKYIHNLNESDIARELNTSRQYINRVHKKALIKLRDTYYK